MPDDPPSADQIAKFLKRIGWREASQPGATEVSFVSPSDLRVSIGPGAAQRDLALADLAAKIARTKEQLLDDIRRLTRAGQPFASLKEGARDPAFNVVIKTLVMETPLFIVYLDDHDDVYWNTADEHVWPEGNGPVLNFISELEAEPIDALHAERREAYRGLVAAGAARLLDGDVSSATAVLEKARAYYEARIFEVGRFWYLVSALPTAAILGLTAIIVLWMQARASAGQPASTSLRESTVELVCVFGAGALGAFISVFYRLSRLPLDARAGRLVLQFEAVLRIFSGAIAALVFAWAVMGKMLLGFGQDASWYQLLVIGFVAGASERAVPSLVDKVEKTATGQSGPPTSGSTPPTSGTAGPAGSSAEKPKGPAGVSVAGVTQDEGNSKKGQQS